MIISFLDAWMKKKLLLRLAEIDADPQPLYDFLSGDDFLNFSDGRLRRVGFYAAALFEFFLRRGPWGVEAMVPSPQNHHHFYFP